MEGLRGQGGLASGLRLPFTMSPRREASMVACRVPAPPPPPDHRLGASPSSLPAPQVCTRPGFGRVSPHSPACQNCELAGRAAQAWGGAPWGQGLSFLFLSPQSMAWGILLHPQACCSPPPWPPGSPPGLMGPRPPPRSLGKCPICLPGPSLPEFGFTVGPHPQSLKAPSHG